MPILNSIPLLVMTAMLLSHSAAALDDGVYEIDKDGTPARPVTLQVTRGHILSQSNANDAWSLFVCFASKGFLEGNSYAVVLDGTVHTIKSSGKSGDAENDFSLNITTAECGAATKLFGFQPIARRHNGYKLDVIFSPDKESYVTGDKITVKMTIRNVGDTPFFFQVGGRNRGPRDDQFSFDCEGPDGTVPVKRAMNFGGMSVIQKIDPGENYTREVALGGWFDLTKPGFYQLKGSYLLSVYAEKNIVGSFSIWEDVLTRSFYFNIKSK